MEEVTALKAELTAFQHSASRESGPSTRQDYTQLLDIDANVHFEPQRQNNQVQSQSQPLIRTQTQTQTQTQTEPHTNDLKRTTTNEARRKKKTRIVLEEYSETDQSEGGSQDRTSRSQKSSRTREHPTEASVVDRRPNEDTILSTTSSSRFQDLRQLLEQQRMARKPRSGTSHNVGEDVSVHTTEHRSVAGQSEARLPKKSSMKNLKSLSKDDANETSHSRKEANVVSAYVQIYES